MQVHEREVFLTKQTETISATQIRGKCQVSLLNKAETLFTYIKAEDSFFYSLVFDRTNQSLLEDKGEIKVDYFYCVQIDQVCKFSYVPRLGPPTSARSRWAQSSQRMTPVSARNWSISAGARPRAI